MNRDNNKYIHKILVIAFVSILCFCCLNSVFAINDDNSNLSSSENIHSSEIDSIEDNDPDSQKPILKDFSENSDDARNNLNYNGLEDNLNSTASFNGLDENLNSTGSFNGLEDELNSAGSFNSFDGDVNFANGSSVVKILIESCHEQKNAKM